MTDDAKKPAIRFAGFTDAWEQRKLGEIVKRVVRKNTNNESSLPLTISAQYGLVDQITYFNNRVASQNVSNYYLILKGEFAYNKSTSDGYPFGAVKRLDYYEKGVLSTLYIIFSLEKPKEFSSNFLAVFFDTDRWYKDVSERATEGARNHGLLNISADDFLDISLNISANKAEQQKIATVLGNLNTLITLQQRKHDKLVSLKKAMLEKMFPQKGADAPEIRFAGFTDAWEQRALATFAQRKSEIGFDASLPNVEYEDIIPDHGRLNKDIFQKESCKVGIKFSNGDVLFGKLRPYLKNWLLPNFSGIAVGDFWVLEPIGIDSKFLYYLIQTPCFFIISNQSSGSKMPRSDWRFVSQNEFFIPQEETEQRTIGDFFRALDTLITLHQRELEKLRNVKKSCLEKMFV